MEREVMLTGLGGQGIQLAAKTLAIAGVYDGLDVMMFGSYTGAMRGGSTEATVVLGTAPIRTPPTASAIWYAIGMHHEYWPNIAARIRPGGLAIIDADAFHGDAQARCWTVERIKADSIATTIDAPQAGAMVALGRLAAASGLVTLGSLERAAREVLPPYRSRFAESNAAALSAGFVHEPGVLAPAWDHGAEELADDGRRRGRA